MNYYELDYSESVTMYLTSSPLDLDLTHTTNTNTNTNTPN